MKAMASTHVQVLIGRLEELKREFGDFAFKAAVKSLRARRLDRRGRENRKQFAWSKYQALYRKQRGMCPLCETAMLLLRGEVEIDHKDPNRAEGFNDDANLQLAHRKCNRRKSSQSLYQQAKKGHRTVVELL